MVCLILVWDVVDNLLIVVKVLYVDMESIGKEVIIYIIDDCFFFVSILVFFVVLIGGEFRVFDVFGGDDYESWVGNL